MFAFHLTWDLGHFGWIDQALIYSKGFHWLGHAIASSFLLLVGVGLALSRRARGKLLRSRAFWRRWAVIAAAAAAISAVSFLFFPETPIFFGILHLIAVASLIAAPLVDAPVWLIVALAALSLAAPEFLAGPFFDARIFWWTGLGTFEPPSNDYQPLFPWLGVVLLGVAGAETPSPRPKSPVGGFGIFQSANRERPICARREGVGSVATQNARLFRAAFAFLLSRPPAGILWSFFTARAFRRLAGAGEFVPWPMRGPVRQRGGAARPLRENLRLRRLARQSGGLLAAPRRRRLDCRREGPNP